MSTEADPDQTREVAPSPEDAKDTASKGATSLASTDVNGSVNHDEIVSEDKTATENTALETSPLPRAALSMDELVARLSKIEERLNEMKKDSSDIDEDEDDNLSETESTTVPKSRGDLCESKLQYMSLKTFDTRGFTVKSKHNAIDVIHSSSDGVFPSDSSTSSLEAEDRVYKDFQQLSFIQINSTALLNAMRPVYTGIRKDEDPYVILTPFKSLHYDEVKLREILSKLKEKWSVTDSTSANGSSLTKTIAIVQSEDSAKARADETSLVVPRAEQEQSVPEEASSDLPKAFKDSKTSTDSESETHTDTGPDSLTAFKDLTLLMDFFDTCVKPWWSFLRSSRAESVHFGDLCALYQPNDFITLPDGSQRIFRVVHITGGRPKLEHLYKGASAQSSDNKRGSDRGNTKADAGLSESDRDKWTKLILDCCYVEHDGKVFIGVARRFTIRPFTGRKDVKKLRPYPLRFASTRFKEECRAEGIRFLDYTNPQKRPALYRYEGRTLDKKSDGGRLCRSGKTYDSEETPVSDYLSPEDVDAQVVVDHDAAFLYNSGWAPPPDDIIEIAGDDLDEDATSDLPITCPLSESNIIVQCFHTHDNRYYKKALDENYWVSDEADDDEEDKEHRKRFVSPDGGFTDDVLLLPNRVFGYVLRTRTWSCFDLSSRAQWKLIRTDNASWNELQIREVHRRTLASLVERHFRNRQAVRQARSVDRADNFDFIEGKGKGLIILLHGAPGVGKTSTAESIASKYGKPLLPITCGNLGTDAMMVEQSLQENFRLAENWGCIVLLDEADVFLARREKNDLQRNALVSVFLRMLEYYTGVLFLTTNRTGDFDEAFRSRIHVSLYYSDLDQNRTLKVWKINLDRVIKQMPGKEYVVTKEGEDKIMKFAARHWQAYGILQRSPWNGRQIRNAFQTAVALAEYKDEISRTDADGSRAPVELTWQHFSKVAVATNQFEAYLIATRGKSEEQEAQEFKLRYKLSVYATEREDDDGEGAEQPRKWRKVSSDKAAKFIKELHPDREVVEPEGLDEAPEVELDPFTENAKSVQRQQSLARASHHLQSPAHTPGPQAPMANMTAQYYDPMMAANGVQMGAPAYSGHQQIYQQGYMPAGHLHNAAAFYQQQQAPAMNPMMAAQNPNSYHAGNIQQPDLSQTRQMPPAQSPFQQNQPPQGVAPSSNQTLSGSPSPLVQHGSQAAANTHGQQMQQNAFGQAVYTAGGQMLT